VKFQKNQEVTVQELIDAGFERVTSGTILSLFSRSTGGIARIKPEETLDEFETIITCQGKIISITKGPHPNTPIKVDLC